MNNSRIAQEVKRVVEGFSADCADVLLPPEEGLVALGQPVINSSLVRGTRGYIERITKQINGTYSNGWYDACAVMIRRMLETLIIEAFEAHGLSARIQGPSGDFFYLKDLIPAALSESSWNLSRNTKRALPKLKDIGDKSAHSRRFNAIRDDIDNVLKDLRDVVQEFLYLSKLK